jgi:two-component system, sensor histidine kinase and response regulator
MLEKQGHSVVVASNGKQALQAMEQQQFDLVLMDVEMPEMSGFEVTAAIRERERETEKHIPIVAVTAHAMKGDMEKCLEAGMDFYLAKPINSAELFEVIAKVSGKPRNSYDLLPPQELNEPVLDKPALMNQVGGDGKFVRQLADLFLTESQDQLSALEKFLEERDADGIARCAHSLKGSLGSLHAARASKAALDLERLARAGDIERVSEGFDVLKKEVERVRAALEKFSPNDFHG